MKSTSQQLSGSKNLITFENEKEFEDYCKANPSLEWVIYQGLVYDVKEYLPQHPGGKEIVTPLIGKSIDDDFEN
jgi:cytochrome b involved in lipid metabolism